MSTRYQRVARTLAPYIGDSDQLLDATDAVIAVVGSIAPSRPTLARLADPAALDVVGLGSEDVMARIIEGKKIHAIKALRDLTGAGLRETKDAVERMQSLPVVRAAQTVVWNVQIDIGE